MLIKADLRQILLRDWGYKEKQVDGVVDKVFAMDPAILIAFENWLASKVFPGSPDYNGINPKNLSETYQMKPPAIFLLLDWIRRDPKEATAALYHEYHRLPGRENKPE